MNQPVALVVAAHPDDEVLGCGGTLAKLHSTGWRTHVLILGEGLTSRTYHSGEDTRGAELDLLHEATKAAHELLDVGTTQVGNLPDNRMDSVPLLDVVKLVESAVRRIEPSRVYTHHIGDVNVDHRVTHEAVQAATRPQPSCSVKELYFFEVPSSTEWRASGGSGQFAPGLFTDISDHLEAKQAALDCYASEMRAWPHPRSRRAVAALANWRGATVGLDAAEAFEVGRIIS